jgi:amino acid adenylation domain-containing protein
MFNQFWAVRLCGPVDREALGRAVSIVDGGDAATIADALERLATGGGTRLYRLADDVHVLGGAGAGVPPLDRLAGSYAAAVDGRAPVLADPPAPAPDDPQFWRDRLADLPRLDLVTDRARPASAPYRAAFAVHHLASRGIEALARASHAPVPAVLLAGLVAVLARYTGEEDVALAATLPAGGTTVVRVAVEEKLSFAELVQRCLAAVVEVARQPTVPAALLYPAGEPARCPVSLGMPPAPATGAGVRFELLTAGPVGLAQDIAVQVTDAVDGLDCQVRYAADLFAASRIDALLRHWQRALHAAARDPAIALAQLPLLDEADQAELLARGQGPALPVPEATLHGLVSARMRADPAAVAGVCDGVELSYGELDRRSAALARFLRAAGVGHEDIVAVVLDRGLHTLVAMLGVLRAGAAYTPVDPAFPAERIGFVLRDAGTNVVLTRAALADAVPSVEGVRVVRLDVDLLDGPPIEEVAGPDSLAYVLYTSGSTGTPKGVQLEHRAIVNYLTWMVGECRIGPDSRMLHACSPVFDLAVGEVFAALTSGARVVVATRDEVLSPGTLTGLIAAHRVTHSFTPPTLASLVDPASCPDLRTVLVAGEPPAPELIHRWLAAGARVMNLYGPAEAAISVTWFDCRPERFGSSVPIGKVMPNRLARVLDRHGNLAPVGVPGELVLGGLGIARGYLNRPELTAERFGTDPYGDRPAYRTGDLVRWNPNGDLEFLGRADTQIKLNGLRIELGEIEAVLAGHPDVAGVAVTVRTDHGPPRLVGYVVGRDGRGPVPAELREHAASRLPAYMVPAGFVTLDRLPLGATGKVNRTALPAPAPTRPELRTRYRAAESPREQALAELVAELLGVSPVGADDGFFELGGSSLDAARLCARLGTRWHRVVPVSQVYRTPTVAGLAGWFELPAPAPAVVPTPGAGAVPLPLSQANLVLGPALLVCPMTWWLAGELDVPGLVAALGDVHRRHQALHVRYLATEPPTARVPDRPGEPEVHILPPAPDDATALRMLDEVAQQPLVLTEGQVWRAVLVPTARPDRYLFGLGIHHAASDGWSQPILARDLGHAYAARRLGHAPVWQRPAPALAEVAQDTVDARAGVDLAAQRAFWLEVLRTLPRMALPGLARGPLPEWGPKAGRVFRVPAEQVRAWDGYARAAGMTRFGYLVAVFGQVLARITGQREVAMMAPVALRGSAVLDAAVCCRMDAVCLRMRVPDGGSAPDWLELAARTVNDAMARQDLPFGEAVTAVAEVRPDLHVILSLPTFLYQDVEPPALDLAGCATETVEDELAKEVPTPLTVEVFGGAEGLRVRVTIRTDRAPVELAERIGTEFLRVLAEGPERG